MRACRDCRATHPGLDAVCALDGAPLEDGPAAPLLGATLDARRLTAHLRSDALGVVYRVEGEGRPLELRVLHGPLAADRALVTRLRRDVAALAALSHPALSAPLEAGRTARGITHVLSEPEPGVTVEALAARGPTEPARAAWILRQVLAALAYLHRHGLAHGAVGPSTVRVEGDGERPGVRLCDLGLAGLLPGAAADASCAADLAGAGRVGAALLPSAPAGPRGPALARLVEALSTAEPGKVERALEALDVLDALFPGLAPPPSPPGRGARLVGLPSEDLPPADSPWGSTADLILAARAPGAPGPGWASDDAPEEDGTADLIHRARAAAPHRGPGDGPAT